MAIELDYSTFVILPNARNARPGMLHLQQNGGIARKTRSGEDSFLDHQVVESVADETSMRRGHSYRSGSSERRASSQSGLSADAPSFVPSRNLRRSKNIGIGRRPRNSRDFSSERSRSPSLPTNYYSPPERAYSPPQRAYSPPQRVSSTFSGVRPYLPPHRRGSSSSYSSHSSSRSSSYSPHSRRK